MKKRQLSMVCIGLTAFLISGMAVHAAQRQPPFFVPQKVLDKMNQPEKLPPLEQMTYDNKLAPNIIEMQQKAKTEAQKQQEQAAETERLAEQKKLEEQRARAAQLELEKLQKEKQLQAEIQHEQKIPEKVQDALDKPQEDSPETEPQYKKFKLISVDNKTPTPAPKLVENQSPPQTDNTPLPPPPQAPTVSSQNTETVAPISNSKRTFDDIIADYKRDALGISQGKPVNNPRLLDILQDYTDERHVL